MKTAQQLKQEDLYTRLEIAESSTIDEVRKAYKKLSLQYHPDRKQDPTGEKFKCISEAHMLLADEEYKEFYDLLLNRLKETSSLERQSQPDTIKAIGKISATLEECNIPFEPFFWNYILKKTVSDRSNILYVLKLVRTVHLSREEILESLKKMDYLIKQESLDSIVSGLDNIDNIDDKVQATLSLEKKTQLQELIRRAPMNVGIDPFQDALNVLANASVFLTIDETDSIKINPEIIAIINYLHERKLHLTLLHKESVDSMLNASEGLFLFIRALDANKTLDIFSFYVAIRGYKFIKDTWHNMIDSNTVQEIDILGAQSIAEELLAVLNKMLNPQSSENRNLDKTFSRDEIDQNKLIQNSPEIRKIIQLLQYKNIPIKQNMLQNLVFKNTCIYIYRLLKAMDSTEKLDAKVVNTLFDNYEEISNLWQEALEMWSRGNTSTGNDTIYLNFFLTTIKDEYPGIIRVIQPVVETHLSNQKATVEVNVSLSEIPTLSYIKVAPETQDKNSSNERLRTYSIESDDSDISSEDDPTRIDARDEGVDDDRITEFAEGLKTNTQLKYLDLSRNKITVKGATALSDALKINKSLEYLDLSNNLIDENGIVKLAEGLKINTSLRTLNLTGNRVFFKVAAQAVLLALEKNRTLTELKGLEQLSVQPKILELLERNKYLATHAQNSKEVIISSSNPKLQLNFPNLATKIQAVVRGHQTRDKLKQEKQAEHLKKEAAATQIQSIVRGHQGRTRLNTLEAADIPKYLEQFVNILHTLANIHDENKNNTNLTSDQKEKLLALFSETHDNFISFYSDKTTENFKKFLNKSTVSIEDVITAFKQEPQVKSPQTSCAQSFLELLRNILNVLKDLFTCSRPQPQEQKLFQPLSAEQVLNKLDLSKLAHQLQSISSQMADDIRPGLN
jgi:curved DNA-binding protein CbpA